MAKCSGLAAQSCIQVTCGWTVDDDCGPCQVRSLGLFEAVDSLRLLIWQQFHSIQPRARFSFQVSHASQRKCRPANIFFLHYSFMDFSLAHISHIACLTSKLLSCFHYIQLLGASLVSESHSSCSSRFKESRGNKTDSAARE